MSATANMLGEALRTVCGPLGDLNQKLSGPNGEEWLTALKRFLRKENPWDGAVTFPTWKTITLGAFQDVKSLTEALEKNGFRVSDWASGILGQPAFTMAAEKTKVKLVKITVAELGFSEGATYGEICDKAQESGFHLCPAETGPQLRLQYGDQPYGEWLTVAMEPIADSDGRPSVFRVGRGVGDRWLASDWTDSDDFWRADAQFVFAG